MNTRLLTRWGVLLGCGTLMLVAVAVVVSVLGRALPWAVLLAGGGLAVLTLVRRRRRSAVIRRFREAYPGIDILITYSTSPHWQEYIERNWLPLYRERAVVFNRSLPWRDNDPHAALWRTFTRGGEHTPSVIVLSAGSMPRVIRFYSAFRDYKHGKHAAMRKAEAELAAAARRPTGPGGVDQAER